MPISTFSFCVTKERIMSETNRKKKCPVCLGTGAAHSNVRDIAKELRVGSLKFPSIMCKKCKGTGINPD